jgi:outer membrane receptor protein involved in Fe transport
MLLAFLLSFSLAQSAVTGVVTDSTGGAVSGATIVARTASGDEQQAVTGPDGRFTIDNVPPGSTLVVRAGGFAAQEQVVANGTVNVVLSPATLLETVTVTPTRGEQRLGDVPASVQVLGSEEIRQSPAVVADDLLRRIPTFSLFRRTSSLSSHPTAQGVSLRGIGPSGVSRTLVLIDNVPFNDPFGGWVYWTRVPLESLDRIEVVDGSSSSLYGNYAMGGVINMVSARPSPRTADIRAQYGNRTSPKLDLFGSDVWGRVGAAVEASMFRTDGYPIVIEGERRTPEDSPAGVDTRAGVEFRNVNAKLDYAMSDRVNTFFRVGYFREERDNGKVSTFPPVLPEANDTTWKSASGGARIVLPDRSDLQARLFYDDSTFSSNFLAIAGTPGRSIGRRTLEQRVPTKSVGGMAQWARAVGTRNHLSIGTDWRWVDGDSNERTFDQVNGQTAILDRVSGGTQRSFGAYVQDIFTPIDRLTLTASARVDRWRNYDGHNLETTIATGLPAPGDVPRLPDRDDTVASPRIAGLYRFTNRVSAWAGVSAGFRAPTLNELYRQFRVGAVLTRANENLGPERLVGGEGGINIAVTDDVTLRTTWFDNRVKNPISNVTVGVNTQQRQNLGRTRVQGIHTDLQYRLGSFWRLSGGYLFDDAKVEEAEGNPTLVGKYLAQVPRHRGSIQVAYSNPRFVVVYVGAQLLGAQFDDDQNTASRELPGYAVVDLTISRAVASNVEAFVGVQNLFDKEFIVGTLPTTIGNPRLANVGVRVRLSGR